MGYKNIDRQLLYRYKKFLIDKRTDLHVRAVGSYWTSYRWTQDDQNSWDKIERKLNKLNRILFY